MLVTGIPEASLACLMLWFVSIARRLGDEFWSRMLLYACFATHSINKTYVRCLEMAWDRDNTAVRLRLSDTIHCS